jgi:hypothetical protein
MSPRPLLLVLLCLISAGCVVGDGPDEATMTTPSFAPEEPEPAVDPGGAEAAAASDAPPPAETEPAVTGERAADSEGDGVEGGDAVDGPSQPAPGGEDRASQEEAGEASPTGEPEAAPLRSHVTDPTGDVETLRLGSPPRHADLVAATLVRDARGYQLAIEVDGGVPERARDGDHTMNVASYYDITGDGHVDVEVWANLADGGWDTARYDNRSGMGAFSDDDRVSVTVDEDRLLLDFPLGVLDGAERFRWAVASEWGRYEELGTPMSARDEMPDDGAPASFPG